MTFSEFEVTSPAPLLSGAFRLRKRFELQGIGAISRVLLGYKVSPRFPYGNRGTYTLIFRMQHDAA
jgi:hypothetical protein